MRGKTCLLLVMLVALFYVNSQAYGDAGPPLVGYGAQALALSHARGDLPAPVQREPRRTGTPLGEDPREAETAPPMEDRLNSQEVAGITAVGSLELDLFYVGEETGGELGWSVSGTGDVNGDGFAGVVVGAPAVSGDVYREGLVYVFLGSVAGLPSTASLTLRGGQRGARFGAAVNGGGDVNNDTYADIIVGAPEWKAGDQLSEAGAVFVYHGSGSGLSDTPSWHFYGDQPRAKLGASVSSAGDVNGDGCDDILVGAPFHGSTSAGAVYLFFGSPTGPVTETVQFIAGEQAGALFGKSVAAAGDVNGDGYADILVGAPSYSRSADLEWEGAAFVYFGSTTGITVTNVWQAYGGQKNAYFGTAVTTIGRASAGGYDGIAVGAPGYDDSEIDQGLVSVYYGSETGLPAEPDWSYTHPHPGFRIGAALSSAGDVNADGYADLLVGAPSYPASADGSQQNALEVALIFLGSPTGLLPTYAWRLETNQSTTNFGSALAGAGRTNYDAFDDIIIGSPQYKSDKNPVGRAFVYLGQEYTPFQDVVFLPLVLRAGP